jgi:hypothetical protein
VRIQQKRLGLGGGKRAISLVIAASNHLVIQFFYFEFKLCPEYFLCVRLPFSFLYFDCGVRETDESRVLYIIISPVIFAGRKNFLGRVKKSQDPKSCVFVFFPKRKRKKETVKFTRERERGKRVSRIEHVTPLTSLSSRREYFRPGSPPFHSTSHAAKVVLSRLSADAKRER